jgi:hypothetical protein
MNKIFIKCLNEGDYFKKLMKGDGRLVPAKQIYNFLDLGII